MQTYTHLTLEQRYQISALLKSNISISEIARQLGYHKSAISCEIKRNKDGIYHTYLRSQKTYRKRGCKANDRRGQIAHRKEINERPTSLSNDNDWAMIMRVIYCGWQRTSRGISDFGG